MQYYGIFQVSMAMIFSSVSNAQYNCRNCYKTFDDVSSLKLHLIEKKCSRKILNEENSSKATLKVRKKSLAHLSENRRGSK